MHTTVSKAQLPYYSEQFTVANGTMRSCHGDARWCAKCCHTYSMENMLLHTIFKSLLLAAVRVVLTV